MKKKKKSVPKGKLVHHRTTVEQRNYGVHCEIFLIDEAIKVWRLRTSSFNFDLQEVEEL